MRERADRKDTKWVMFGWLLVVLLVEMLTIGGESAHCVVE
jgi:hypothetical protein